MKPVKDNEIEHGALTLSNSLVNYTRTDDHAVQIYKNSHPLKITFTVSKYATGTLGQLMRKLRLEKGLEQWELAKRLRVHRNTVYEWENDRHKPYGKSIERLAKFFNVSRKTLEDFRMGRNKSL